MLGGPRDGALLHFSLGNEYLKAGDPAQAANCFQNTVDRDSHYPAARKAMAESGDAASALAAYEQGIAAAEAKGDIQAAKEMTVFAKRLRKAGAG